MDPRMAGGDYATRRNRGTRTATKDGLKVSEAGVPPTQRASPDGVPAGRGGRSQTGTEYEGEPSPSLSPSYQQAQALRAPKHHFWPHMQAGWARAGHTFGLFFWPHVQLKVVYVPKLRY